ncbi:hypothetical protein NST02_23275 [Robertmurraya sp. FSL W8-0741]|uniref:hypothetical protein n=1 Tax=Robertmurraya TaxID=2837507 RepID=UPI0010F5EC9A|nr:hypothetical protein [Robertmurraya siralis]
MKNDEIRPEITDIFRKLNINSKENRKKYTFGSTLLDDETNSKFVTKHIVVTPTERGEQR